MKEIKAYVRPEKAEEVSRALSEAGSPGFTFVEVKGAGGAVVPEDETFSVDIAEKVSPVVKIEVVCRDKDADKIVRAIAKSARSGHPGDGMITVCSLDRTLKIRSGEQAGE